MRSAVRLGDNSYGKSRVRLVKVRRDGERHEVVELNAAIALRGDFERAHTHGDNSLVLPTDTMKNTVYALAKDHALRAIEEFAIDLGEHFLRAAGHISSARIAIKETPWERLKVDGADHPHAFRREQGEMRECTVVCRRGAPPTIQSGIEGLVLLKSTNSAFSGFLKDRYTTLRETRDRIFATSVTARWEYVRSPESFPDARAAIRSAFIRGFTNHMSESVQQSLLIMGDEALQACPSIDAISLCLPNKHCLLVDLSPFGLTNRNEIFHPVDEPHGLIEATIERSRA